MNERITQLALEASDPKTGWLDRKKFAELIVKECCDVLDPGTLEIFAGFQARKYLVEHFGVEE